MNKSLQLRRGTTVQHSTFTGLEGELSINVDDFTIILHDGVTPGGIPFSRVDYVDAQLATKSGVFDSLSGYGILDAYTITETDNLLATKSDIHNSLSGYGILDAYTITQVNSFLSAKANIASTLGGYGILDAYTITETDALLLDKADSTNVVNSVAGLNGIILATDLTTAINVEPGAQVNNISDLNATELTGGGDSTLHFHSSDRDRANHTGTQTLSTISDAGTMASQNSNNVNVSGGTITSGVTITQADDLDLLMWMGA